MARPATLRASDDDRERVAERLRVAASEGRLLAHELEERLATALRARTYGELDAVVGDLPGQRGRREAPLLLRGAVALTVALAVLAALAIVAIVVFAIATAWFAWMIVAWLFFGLRARRGRARVPLRLIR